MQCIVDALSKQYTWTVQSSSDTHGARLHSSPHDCNRSYAWLGARKPQHPLVDQTRTLQSKPFPGRNTSTRHTLTCTHTHACPEFLATFASLWSVWNRDLNFCVLTLGADQGHHKYELCVYGVAYEIHAASLVEKYHIRLHPLLWNLSQLFIIINDIVLVVRICCCIILIYNSDGT